MVNYAHLRSLVGDEDGKRALHELVVRTEELRADGIVNADSVYWVASAYAVMGETERALEALEEAVTRGWRHAWWTRHDWNWVGFEGNSRYRDLLARGAVGVP